MGWVCKYAPRQRYTGRNHLSQELSGPGNTGKWPLNITSQLLIFRTSLYWVSGPCPCIAFLLVNGLVLALDELSFSCDLILKERDALLNEIDWQPENVQKFGWTVTSLFWNWCFESFWLTFHLALEKKKNQSQTFRVGKKCGVISSPSLHFWVRKHSLRDMKWKLWIQRLSICTAFGNHGAGRSWTVLSLPDSRLRSRF